MIGDRGRRGRDREVLRGHLIGSVQAVSEYAAAARVCVSYPPPIVGWSLLYIQRQLATLSATLT
jgi:hypothetical protein